MTIDFLDSVQDFLVHDAAVAALAGTRVFPMELPADEATAMPRGAVVLRLAGGSERIAPVRMPKFDVLAYGPTPKEARRLWLAVDEALARLARDVHVGCLLHSAQLLAGPIGTREPETHWPLAWGSWQLIAGTEEVGG